MNMAKLQISPKAANDLLDIKKYIMEELQNESAALNTILKITKAMLDVLDFPQSGTPLSSIIDITCEYRFLVCGSYLIFYRFNDDIVSVVRVLYGGRDYMRILFNEFLDEG